MKIRNKVLLCAYLCMIVSCSNHKIVSCVQYWSTYDFKSKSFKAGSWILEKPYCDSIQIIKNFEHNIIFYQKHDLNYIYRNMGKKYVISHSLKINKYISAPINNACFYFPMLNQVSKLLIVKNIVVNNKPYEIYVYDEYTGNHKHYHSYYNKHDSFFMYYDIESDQLLYYVEKINNIQMPIVVSKVLLDSTIFFRNSILDENKKIEYLIEKKLVK